jgi:hypothetical protein
MIVDLFLIPVYETAVVVRIKGNSCQVKSLDYDWRNLSLDSNSRGRIEIDDTLSVKFSPIFHTRISYFIPKRDLCVSDLSFGFLLFIIILNLIVFILFVIQPEFLDKILRDQTNYGILDYLAYGEYFILLKIFIFLIPFVINIFLWYKFIDYLL